MIARLLLYSGPAFARNSPPDLQAVASHGRSRHAARNLRGHVGEGSAEIVALGTEPGFGFRNGDTYTAAMAYRTADRISTLRSHPRQESMGSLRCRSAFE